VLRYAAVAFAVWHATAVLVTGAEPNYRDYVWPLFSWYGDGLAMTNTWGMFGKPPRMDEVLVLAHRRDGASYELSTNWTSERIGFERVADVRLRKVQTQVALPDLRNRFGRHFLAYYCRQAVARDPSVVRVELRVEQPAGAPSADFNPGTHTLLVERCNARRAD
jgi:hypothetical protein